MPFENVRALWAGKRSSSLCQGHHEVMQLFLGGPKGHVLFPRSRRPSGWVKERADHKDLSLQKPVTRWSSAKAGLAHSEGSFLGVTSQVGATVFSEA